MQQLIEQWHAVRRLLGPTGEPTLNVWHGYSCVFLSAAPTTLSGISQCGSVFTCARAGKAFARAISARENAESAELGVAAERERRRQGFAIAVSNAWTRYKMDGGGYRIP